MFSVLSPTLTYIRYYIVCYAQLLFLFDVSAMSTIMPCFCVYQSFFFQWTLWTVFTYALKCTITFLYHFYYMPCINDFALSSLWNGRSRDIMLLSCCLHTCALLATPDTPYLPVSCPTTDLADTACCYTSVLACVCLSSAHFCLPQEPQIFTSPVELCLPVHIIQ